MNYEFEGFASKFAVTHMGLKLEVRLPKVRSRLQMSEHIIQLFYSWGIRCKH